MSKKTDAEKEKKKKKEVPDLTDAVFSWSLQDVLNTNLYKGQVKNIAKTFQSTDEYKSSFVLPLIEETHADLRSTFENMRNPPAREAMSIEMVKKKKSNSKTHLYKMKLKRTTNVGDCNYKPHSGDLIALTSTRPKNIHDFRRPGQAYLVAYVQGYVNDDPDLLMILSSGPVVSEQDPPELGRRECLFAVYLVNLTTNNRIYRALDTEHKGWNLKIINQVLQKNPSNGENCEACYSRVNQSKKYSETRSILESSNLNDSQGSAILSGICLSECKDQSSVKLIWGPPGTGKTKTTGLLLFCLLKLKCRTLTCAPTNTAVLEVAKRLMTSVTNSFGCETYGFGDVVLFGNRERMKISDEDVLVHVFLDHRVNVLLKCCGYNHSLATMIKLLRVSEENYGLYLSEKKETAEKGVVQHDQTSNTRRNLKQNQKLKRFAKTFSTAHEKLEFCISSLCTHLPTSLVSQQVVEKMNRALDLLRSLEGLLSSAKQFLSYELESVVYRKDCLSILKSIEKGFKLPKLTNKRAVEKFCLAKARLIFCTASSSVKLQRQRMGVDLLVIDEAAQLKECESMIPLQISGLRHAVLIGDELQLPAMVQSKISENAEFGRSLFERLVLVGHKKHLLNVQYRMHPSISMFPNREFYERQILDAPLVRETSYKRQVLEGNMYGSFSFIDVAYGKDQLYEGCSTRNMVEVFVVSEILATLYKEVVKSKKKISVGVISPYKAQVHAIQEKISNSYSSKVDKGFSVSVKSVDGFQGSEEDVIIISTVRSNVNGSVGFLSNFQRANVALTRARYCLWIVGNGSTLVSSDSIWKSLVMDARDRGCFFDAEDDERLSRAMVASLVELGQFGTLFQRDCLLLRKSIWKVCFSDEFMKSLARMKDKRISKEVVSVIEKISRGWRHTHKRRSSIVVVDGVSSQVLEKYKVCGGLKLVWSIDILREDSYYTQVIKVWDVVPDNDVPNLAKRLYVLFGDYSASKMEMCTDKSEQGNLVVPMKWLAEHEDVQILSKSLASMTIEDESSERVLELEH